MATEDGTPQAEPPEVSPQGGKRDVAPQADERAWRRRADTLFSQALELPSAERPALLERACAGDRRLRRKVERLLAADREVGDFLEPARRSTADCAGDGPSSAAGAVPEVGRGSFADRGGKLVRRQRVALAAQVAVAVLVLGSVAALVWQTRELTHERDRAERALALLVDVLKAKEPGYARGETITVRQILDRGAERILDATEGQPELRATLMDAIGQVYLDLGLFERAEPLLEGALELRRERYADGHPMVADSQQHLAALRHEMGDYPAAESLFREGSHPRVAQSPDRSLLNLAAIAESHGNHREAEDLALEAVERQRRRLGPRHPDLVSGLNRLGQIRIELGELAAAEGHFLEAMAIARATLGADHPRVARVASGLASVMLRRGDLEAAERLYQESLAGLSRALDDRHGDLAAPLTGLARVALARVDPQAAEPLLRRALGIMRASLPRDHWQIAEAESDLGACLVAAGRGRDAATLLESSAATLTAHFGAEDGRAERARRRLEDLRR